MFRYSLLLVLALMPGCAQRSPALPPADAETIDRAVQHAQAQVDQRPARERGR